MDKSIWADISKKKGRRPHVKIPHARGDLRSSDPGILEQELELDANTLNQVLKQLEQASMGQEPDAKPKEVDVDLPVIPAYIPTNWKSKIAHESRNAVVKILSTVLEFDWELPYRKLDNTQSIGTGFFVSETGIFVTNAHVIEEAAKVWITVPSEGERRYDAEVLGVCFDVDLAVLQAKDTPVLKWLEFGDSNSVQYGEEVITLGYPLGMDSLKLTEGVISGRQDGYFQTDAPLNPGNSGGPMLNREGKVIGVNVAIVEKSQNVGFAIPVYHLVQLYPTLKSRPVDARVTHKPILGAEMSNSSEAMLRFMGCPKERTGVFITKCFQGFPMWNAGVREGDLLHKFNKFQLDNFGHAEVPWSPYARASLDSLVALCAPDSIVEIEYSRNGVLTTTNVSFEDPARPGYPILPAVREYQPPYEKIDYEVIGGMVVMELTLNHIQLFHEEAANAAVLRFLTPIATSFEERLKPSLVVTSILLGSLLSRVDVYQPGTILESVNDIKVSTLKEFRDAILHPIKKDSGYFITFRSKQNELVILPLQESIMEEFELSKMHMYNISPLVVQGIRHNLDYVSKGDPKLKHVIQALLRRQKRLEEEQLEQDNE